MKSYSESSLRSKLYRRGYRLTKLTDGYGVKHYMIADAATGYAVYGDDRTCFQLEDIADWIEWFDQQDD